MYIYFWVYIVVNTTSTPGALTTTMPSSKSMWQVKHEQYKKAAWKKSRIQMGIRNIVTAFQQFIVPFQTYPETVFNIRL